MEQSIELESRHENNIYTLKILEIRENNAVVKSPLNPKICVLVPLFDSDYYGAGIYIDVQFVGTGKSSFKADLIGITEPQFVPNDGEEIF
ncbi:hypothetical protein [Lactobacillus taiwanensis]|uniref:hypothetical protein n=1 Tax=Lactobacillus taiwanensis TaxID=508451 RepID=UPI0027306F8A|nr:hypothetical protein [Lactobacillus taiwanensis]